MYLNQPLDRGTFLMSKNTLRESSALPEGPWLKSKEAAEQLGIHYKTLYALKREGYLQPVKHYIQSSAGRNAAILWNIDACRLQQAKFAAPVRGGSK